MEAARLSFYYGDEPFYVRLSVLRPVNLVWEFGGGAKWRQFGANRRWGRTRITVGPTSLAVFDD